MQKCDFKVDKGSFMTSCSLDQKNLERERTRTTYLKSDTNELEDLKLKLVTTKSSFWNFSASLL